MSKMREATPSPALDPATVEACAKAAIKAAAGFSEFSVQYAAINLAVTFIRALATNAKTPGNAEAAEVRREDFAAHMARLLFNDATLDDCSETEKSAWLDATDALMRIFDIRARGVLSGQTGNAMDFCEWLKGYFQGIPDRDELTAFEANTIRNELTSRVFPQGASVSAYDGGSK